MSGANASGDSSLGQLLKDARERRGLTLQQVSSDTKIPLRHLEAFERDDLGALPAGLYLRGQLRACAKAVHLDPDFALTRLDRQQGSWTAAVVKALPPTPAPAPRHRRLRAAAAAAFVVCAVSAAIWFWRELPAPVNREPVANAPEPQPAQIGDRQKPDGVTGTTLPAVEQSQPTPSPATISGSQLVVTTEPAGARVTVNGIGWGTSPVTIRHLEPGDKLVRVNLDGYQAAERGISLSEGQTGQVSIRLRPAP